MVKFPFQSGYKAFTEFVKLCPYYAEAFPFVKKKEEEFSYLLEAHARKVTGEFGVLAKVVNEVINGSPICYLQSQNNNIVILNTK